MDRSRSRAWYAAIATAFFLVADNFRLVLRPLRLSRFLSSDGILGIRDTLQVGIVWLGASLSSGRLRGAARELGLTHRSWPALQFGFLASLPMLAGFALNSRMNASLDLASVGVGCFLAPFAEEVLFRGYLFRQLYARARLGFWASALIPSVLFALGHLYQSNNPSELAGIVAITGLGSILGCWILLRWRMNLWTVVALHSLMNFWWEVFAVDTTALGGWLANAARLGTIALAIWLTIFKDRIWPVEASADVQRPPVDSRESGAENREERRGRFRNPGFGTYGIRSVEIVKLQPVRESQA